MLHFGIYVGRLYSVTKGPLNILWGGFYFEIMEGIKTFCAFVYIMFYYLIHIFIWSLRDGLFLSLLTNENNNCVKVNWMQGWNSSQNQFQYFGHHFGLVHILFQIFVSFQKCHTLTEICSLIILYEEFLFNLKGITHIL